MRGLSLAGASCGRLEIGLSLGRGGGTAMAVSRVCEVLPGIAG